LRAAVIGSTGQLGQDLMRAFGEETVGLAHQELDVTDGVGVASAMRSLRPDWVLNTAAFHRVDDCETNPALAFAANALGASNVARAAADVGAGVVFYSTDMSSGARSGSGTTLTTSGIAFGPSTSTASPKRPASSS
jgi:dTDP-4-dehydrorhamnose reductase